MKIGYAKWTMNTTLVIGILWMLVGAFRFYEYLVTGEAEWYNVIFMFLGPMYLGQYFLQKGRKYLTFDDRYIQINSYLPKLIWLTDLQEVKFVAGDYHFISKKGNSIVINKESMDQKLVSEFDEKFNNLRQSLEQHAISALKADVRK